jgi:hypothetical protein
MDYTVKHHSQCRTDVSSSHYTIETGRDESGNNAAYAATATADTPQYGYGESGSGNTPYTIVAEETSFGEKIVMKVLGRGEARDDGSTVEVRETARVAFDYYFGSQHLNLDLTVGEDGVPLVITDGYTAGTAAVDGVVRYETNACDGGRVKYTTLQKLSYVVDEFGRPYIAGGRLLIESGGASVTLSFGPTGDVQYVFGSGATGGISRGSLQSGGACLFIP